MEFIYRGYILRIFVGMMALLLLLTGSANALSNSGGGSWHYYRNISINNTAGTLTDYQVHVDLTGSIFPIESNGSGADVRFTDTNGAELSYWIKEWDYANRTGRIWVNVTRIDEHGNTGLRMWYGNPRARSSSNGTSTFEFYDDFDDNSFDTVRWSEECTKQSGGEYVPIPCVDHVIERNQVLEINLESDAGYNANTDVWSNNNYPEGTAIEYDYKNADSYSYLYKHQLLHSDTDDNTGWGWGDWGPLDFSGIENGNTSVIHIKDYVSNDNFWFNGQLIYNSNRTVRGIMTRYDGVIYGDVLNSSFPIKPPRRLLLQTTLWYGGTPKRIYYDNIRIRKYAEPELSVSIGHEIVLTHSVCPSGCDFARIQDAIDNASDGDTILVYSGTYYENVNLNKQLTLRGIGEPVVDARVSGSAITLAADGIRLEGFTSTGTSGWPEAGIKVNSNNNLLENNTVFGNEYGIILYNSSHNKLNGNYANLNDFIGINLRNSSNNTLINNIILNNDFSGIYLHDSDNNMLIGNYANSNVAYGIVLFQSNNNTLNGNYANLNNYTGIWLAHSISNTLNGNYANSNKEDGIYFWSSSNNKLINNIMKGNKYNFDLYAIYYSNFDNLIDVSNLVNEKPIYYMQNIKDAVYDSSTNAGIIYCINCINVTIKDLKLSENAVGILLSNTSNSRIQNINSSNNRYAVFLEYSHDNTLSDNNTVSNNEFGMILITSTENIIYHNNFINNTRQAYDSPQTDYNSWDSGYPTGGNYWSDYTGTDANSDGIGETPYNISGQAGAQDRYPFMRENGWITTNNSPVADCGPDKLRCENVNSPVQFNGSASFDPDGTIVSYEWEFGDGFFYRGMDNSPKHMFFTYRWNGTAYQPFIANLTVTDNSGLTNRTSQNVTIWMAGDANGDGKVNIIDASIVGLRWGGSDPCADLNNDGKVNILDASIMGLNWGRIV